MTKIQEQKYQDIKILKEILCQLKDQKFKLDCGHHITFGYFLGQDIIIYNGKNPEIICTQCGY